MESGAIGRRIRELRLAADMSVEELASLAESSAGTISRLERGQVQEPKLALLSRVARALGHDSIDVLLTGTEPAHNRTPAPRQANAPPSPGSYNVVGREEDLRDASIRERPVYRWGSAGNPLDREDAPDPDHMSFPPVGKELLIGARGFGVIVKGDSMTGAGIQDGDVVWINPDASPRDGRVVLALVDNGNGESGMVIKRLGRNEVGRVLFSDREGGREMLSCRAFTVIGPVVWIAPQGFPPRG